MIKVLFWLLVAIDAIVLVIFGLLGLAAAGPSRTNPIAALMIPFFIPGAILLGAVWLFLSVQAPGARVLALLIAASPLLFVVGSQVAGRWQLKGFRDASGNIRQFRSESLRAIETAILANDAGAVATAARGAAELNTPGLSGATALVLAFRQLRKSPGELDVIRALIAAGADPNVSKVELPLQVAIGESRASGPEPVRLLLEAGAKPNQRSEGGGPVFFFAGGAGIDVGILELLLKHGADVRLKDAQGRSAVVTAAIVGNWPVLELLLQRGAPWQDQKGTGGLPFLNFIEVEANKVPPQTASTNGLARVMALLR
ncbi:MAG: hypothetical protein JNN07_00265 [Verrucomicrobiales bacterium]|nr:hypothetical protein [Verrucomicrobiales bacterium]